LTIRVLIWRLVRYIQLNIVDLWGMGMENGSETEAMEKYEC
jgi:hypothetical protein